MTTACEKCGHEIHIGEHPFCPHGFPLKGLTVIDDSIPGGMVLENLDKTPTRYDSRSDIRRRMNELGVERKVEHKPPPDSDKSPHTQRWI